MVPQGTSNLDGPVNHYYVLQEIGRVLTERLTGTRPLHILHSWKNATPVNGGNGVGAAASYRGQFPDRTPSALLAVWEMRKELTMQSHVL